MSWAIFRTIAPCVYPVYCYRSRWHPARGNAGKLHASITCRNCRRRQTVGPDTRTGHAVFLRRTGTSSSEEATRPPGCYRASGVSLPPRGYSCPREDEYLSARDPDAVPLPARRPLSLKTPVPSPDTLPSLPGREIVRIRCLTRCDKDSHYCHREASCRP